MYKTQGYSAPEGSVKPYTILKTAILEKNAGNMLRSQANRETDPARRQELLYIAALEDKFALKAQTAQQLVQDATMGRDPILPGAFQRIAMDNRGRMRDEASREYNAALPLGYAGGKKDVGNPFYRG